LHKFIKIDNYSKSNVSVSYSPIGGLLTQEPAVSGSNIFLNYKISSTPCR